uniref:Uncharacterized protein n=1 Tax=Kalanchoe fedtschenkoi TaxID=63787 RepID=A0A7N0RGY7_KALFE
MMIDSVYGDVKSRTCPGDHHLFFLVRVPGEINTRALHISSFHWPRMLHAAPCIFQLIRRMSNYGLDTFSHRFLLAKVRQQRCQDTRRLDAIV